MHSSLGFTPQQPQSSYLQQAFINVLKNPWAGVPICHYKARLAEDETFDKYGHPDYMASQSGDFDSGVLYDANPSNPLRGVYCRAPLRPNLDPGGFTLQAELDLYLPVDVGDVFVLEGDRPKRQDRFDIQGGRFYAAGPSIPCQGGEIVGLWKIPIIRERFPTRLDSENGLSSNSHGWQPSSGF